MGFSAAVTMRIQAKACLEKPQDRRAKRLDRTKDLFTMICIVEREGFAAWSDALLNDQHALGEKRGELRVGQETVRRFEGAGGVAWRCRVVRHAASTASCSNAMDKTTSRGTRCQRTSRRALSGS